MTGVRQQRAEELCAGVIRAFSGHLNVQFRGHRLVQGQRPVPVHAPHLQPYQEQGDFTSARGAADGIALRLRYSDAADHRQVSPTAPVERLIFEMLEQLRVETLVPDEMPGMLQNLRHRFSAWSQAMHFAGVTESESGLLLYTVFQMAWSRLNGWPVLAQTEDQIEASRAALAPRLGNDLAGLRRTRHRQMSYARHARSLAELVGAMMPDAGRNERISRRRDEGNDLDAHEPEAGFQLLPDFDSDDGMAAAASGAGDDACRNHAAQAYPIFTRRYDRVAEARSLIRKALLREYRERLDSRIAGLGINQARLVRQLTALLCRPQRDGWSSGEEEGHIDGRRLAQLIASPSERRLFRKDYLKPNADCLVSFLIDCSGSMKEHAESVAIMIDVLVRALEQVGVTTEVLGFTTAAWNGGRARRDWIAANAPRNPGRLNELLHLIFKDANSTWRSRRADLAALLKADLYREGMDGEAIIWACERMRGRNEKRRILAVVSDGCPMDGATIQANGASFLAEHLSVVVARSELHEGVEICGLGVGLDLSTFYRYGLAIDLSESLNNARLADIAQAVCAPRRRGVG